jgi:hypothetical protein
MTNETNTNLDEMDFSISLMRKEWVMIYKALRFASNSLRGPEIDTNPIRLSDDIWREVNDFDERMVNCPDCNCKVGECHDSGCDQERCTVCHGQWIACGHKKHKPELAKWRGLEDDGCWL